MPHRNRQNDEGAHGPPPDKQQREPPHRVPEQHVVAEHPFGDEPEDRQSRKTAQIAPDKRLATTVGTRQLDGESNAEQHPEDGVEPFAEQEPQRLLEECRAGARGRSRRRRLVVVEVHEVHADQGQPPEDVEDTHPLPGWHRTNG